MAKPRKPAPQKVGLDSISQTNTKAIVLSSVGIVLALALVVGGIFVFGGDDDNGTATDVREFQPVTVTGEPLPRYSSSNGAPADEAIGAQAPDLAGKSFEGETVNITKDGRGKALVFATHWCQHCQAEIPLMSDWIPDNRSKYPNVDFYLISTGSNPRSGNYPPSDWLKDEDWPTTVMADNNNADAATAYGLGSYPYMVFLDGQNKVVGRTSGEIAMSDFGNFIQRAQDAATGAPVTTTTAAPGGPTTTAPQTVTP
jgi:thiol-disulfide isomerase/thioredoxin